MPRDLVTKSGPRSLWEQNSLLAVFLKILLQCTNSKREKVCFGPIFPHHDPYYLLKGTAHKEGLGNRFSPIGANAIWDQHFRFSSR